MTYREYWQAEHDARKLYCLAGPENDTTVRTRFATYEDLNAYEIARGRAWKQLCDTPDSERDHRGYIRAKLAGEIG